MYTFIEDSIRGGISMISTRYADIPDIVKELRTHLIYLDANNLYGWAMSQYLPTHGFKFLTGEEVFPACDINTHLASISDTADTGYILEVDLEYPTTLHDSHNDYPLAVESLEISRAMLSPLQQKKFPVEPPQVKLTPNLDDKSKYVVHYRNLKLYTQLGMVVSRVHRVLQFQQTPWLKTYIDFNTMQRSLATTVFGKDFYKLMDNSVFGKTQENLRKRVNIELITNAKLLKKRVVRPAFNRGDVITEDLAIIQRRVSTLKLNRPIYVGFCVLELSKLHMYKFHYNHMKVKYPQEGQLKLLFTDTDSLAYAIKAEDICADMLNDSHLLDISGYQDDHPWFASMSLDEVKRVKQLNKKAIGKFKDELDGVPLQEFVGLRPKLYSLLYENAGIVVSKKTAKGVMSVVKDRHLRHEYYKNTLLSPGSYNASQNLIRSQHHTLTTRAIRKVALTAFDTKRWLLADGINTRAHGHHLNIMENVER